MGGGKPAFEMPDWRKYKVDGIKELEWTRKHLETKGLKDPWLRNEVWRYQDYPGPAKLMRQSLFRGFKWALAAMVVTVAVDMVVGFSSKHGSHGSHH